MNISGENTGLFSRVSAFYDHYHMDNQLIRTPLTPEGKEKVGADARLVDFYNHYDFETDNTIGNIRLGNQIISWGESTFVPSSLALINPIDINQFRVTGGEVRDALILVPMIVGSVSPNNNLPFEGFVQLKWEPIEADPIGSYFSTTDSLAPGGNSLELDLSSFFPKILRDDQDDGLEVQLGPDN